MAAFHSYDLESSLYQGVDDLLPRTTGQRTRHNSMALRIRSINSSGDALA